MAYSDETLGESKRRFQIETLVSKAAQGDSQAMSELSSSYPDVAKNLKRQIKSEAIKELYYRQELSPEQLAAAKELENRGELDLKGHVRKRLSQDLAEDQSWWESYKIGAGEGLGNIATGVGAIDKRSVEDTAGLEALSSANPVSSALGKMTGEAAPFMAVAGPIGAIESLPIRTTVSSAAGAVEGGVLANAQGADQIENAAIGGILAGTTEAVLPVIGGMANKLVQKVFGRTPRGALITAAGKPTEELSQALSSMGLTFEDLVEDSVNVLKKAKTGANPEQTARKALFAQEGVPASKGDITKDYKQQVKEARLFESSEDTAAEPFREFRFNQSQRIQDRLEDIFGTSYLTGNRESKEETGRLIHDALMGRKDLLTTQKNDLYDEFLNASKESYGFIPKEKRPDFKVSVVKRGQQNAEDLLTEFYNQTDKKDLLLHDSGYAIMEKVLADEGGDRLILRGPDNKILGASSLHMFNDVAENGKPIKELELGLLGTTGDVKYSGSALMESVADVAIKHKVDKMTWWPLDDESVKFYKKLGFNQLQDGSFEAGKEDLKKFLADSKNPNKRISFLDLPVFTNSVQDAIPGTEVMSDLAITSPDAINKLDQLLTKYGIKNFTKEETTWYSPFEERSIKLKHNAEDNLFYPTGFVGGADEKLMGELEFSSFEEAKKRLNRLGYKNVTKKVESDVTPLSTSNFEQFRKSLNAIKRGDSTGASDVAINPIINALDNELDNLAGVMEKHGFSSQVVEPLKAARSTVRTLKTEFSPQNIIGKIVDTKRDGYTQIIEASKVYDKFTSKGAKIEDVRKLVDSLNKSPSGKEALASIQATTILDLIDAGFGSEARVLKGKKYFNPVAFKKRLNNISYQKLDTIFKDNPTALKKLRNIDKVISETIPDVGTAPKGSASVILDLMNNLGLVAISSKVPVLGPVVGGAIKNITAPIKTGGDVATALKAAPDVMKFRSFVSRRFPGIASALAIQQKVQQDVEENNQ